MNKCPTPKVNRHNKPPPRYTLPRIWTARKLEKRRDIFQIVAVEWSGEREERWGPPTSAVMRLLWNESKGSHRFGRVYNAASSKAGASRAQLGVITLSWAWKHGFHVSCWTSLHSTKLNMWLYFLLYTLWTILLTFANLTTNHVMCCLKLCIASPTCFMMSSIKSVKGATGSLAAAKGFSLIFSRAIMLGECKIGVSSEQPPLSSPSSLSV